MPPTHCSTQKSPPSLPPGLLHLPTRHSLTTPTLHTLAHLPRSPPPRIILEFISKSPDIPHYLTRPEPSQQSFLLACNSAPTLRWRLPIGTRPSLPWHKPFLLYQIFLLPPTAMPNALTPGARKLLLQEKKQLFRHLAIVLRCTADLLGIRGDYRGVTTTLYLLRSLSSGTFDESPAEILQIPGISPKKLEALVTAGITSSRQFASLDSSHIERLLKRQPPFGEGMRRTMTQFPKLTVSVRQVGRRVIDVLGTRGTKKAEAVVEVVLGMEDTEAPRWQGRVLRVVFWAGSEETGDLVFFWRGPVGKIEKERDGEGEGKGRGVVLRFLVEEDATRKLECQFGCEEVAGSLVSCSTVLV